MRVVMGLQQLESSRTIEQLSGSHSEERLGRLSLENGPEYKRPRVSAFRDFPPGCGQYATSVGTSNGIGMDMTVAKKYPPQRIVEYVRDFPPQCGINICFEAKAFDDVKKSEVDVQDEELHYSELKADVSQVNGGYFLPSNMMERRMERPREKSFDISNSHNHLLEEDVESSELKLNKVIPNLKPASHPSWWKGKVARKSKPGGGMSERQGEKPDSKLQLERSKDAWRTKVGSEIGGHSKKNIHSIAGKTTGFGQASSSSSLHDNNTDAIRKKVTETLGRFKALCRQLEHDKSKEGGTPLRRVDLKAAKILKKEGKHINTGKQILGHVPGVEVGDEFHYRIELNIVGLHHPTQGGIDYATFGGKMLATSIVASGGYADDLHNLNSLTYTGQGGNVMHPDKEPEDQKLQRGNLALKNSMHAKTPVRMIRGSESSDGRTKYYIYDGLYLVVKCWKEMGPHGKLVFKFQLDRIEGQSLLRKK
ncbi:putative methyltransferase [Rosa chinensis]|uniref:Putative methyltransferase n=1 Tax=Rosa chinensis TaxID=74649 RepID=A0A2P6P8U4_ROSCH|nr:histone-lysine N-methyltransferase, H3 lysine-9 specific SUVH6 [Rosa chinensis]XP_024173776.1 histone-lysine N-methyltransferase, H3 lysine-9 specific SUVH6 [Rosa chinensis]XP_024173778.1 histone-lysine N-methyltransferase, H3 lysine-9 specific SUVH6 [Rosa chinensis]PRQ18348.1 putative methyltransferase [Rosa chinensis]